MQNKAILTEKESAPLQGSESAQSGQTTENKWQVPEIEISLKRKYLSPVKIVNSNAAYSVFMSMWDHNLMHVQEMFSVIYLNRANKVIGYRCVGMGMLSSVQTDINLILAIGLKIRASGIVAAHNHPSGNLKPSKADKKFTDKLWYALYRMDMCIIDNLIITENGYYSFADNNLLTTNSRL